MSLVNSKSNSSIGKGMDRLASVYDLISFVLSFGLVRKTNRRICEFRIKASRIAVIGGGNGKILSDLRKYYPNASIDFLELSGQMLKNASDLNIENIRLIHGDETKLDGPYDMIALPFILNCYDHSAQLEFLLKIKSHLSTQATIVVGDFNPNQNSFLYRLYLRALFFGFGSLVSIEPKRLANFENSLQKIGFVESHSAYNNTSWYLAKAYLRKQNQK